MITSIEHVLVLRIIILTSVTICQFLGKMLVYIVSINIVNLRCRHENMYNLKNIYKYNVVFFCKCAVRAPQFLFSGE